MNWRQINKKGRRFEVHLTTALQEYTLLIVCYGDGNVSDTQHSFHHLFIGKRPEQDAIELHCENLEINSPLFWFYSILSILIAVRWIEVVIKYFGFISFELASMVSVQMYTIRV